MFDQRKRVLVTLKIRNVSKTVEDCCALGHPVVIRYPLLQTKRSVTY